VTLPRNLTQFESLALDSPLNLADGHARSDLTPSQARIVDALPKLFAEAAERPVGELEAESHRTFLTSLGQRDYPAGAVLSCYSSSVAMQILAQALATRIGTVALVHPTFDNIPDILRGAGLSLIPVPENDIQARGDCVFVTTPNNPTGKVLSEAGLRDLAAQCAERDVILALDTSFRGFDPRSHFDHYSVLRASGCRWAVIEDTGKLWPTLDLKAGLLIASENIGIPIADIHSDILLGISPLVLVLVQRFAEDAAVGGLADLHRFIAGNRETVRSGLAGLPGVTFPDPDSRVSVERIGLGRRSAVDVWSALREHNVYTLPCHQFHWADPASGANTLRIALARPAGTLSAAVRVLRSVLTG
jgi:enduracididine biosynthesis enzyme MppP